MSHEALEEHLHEIAQQLKQLNETVAKLVAAPATSKRSRMMASGSAEKKKVHTLLPDADFSEPHNAVFAALDYVHSNGSLSGWPADFADDVLSRGYETLTEKQFAAACKIISECGFNKLADVPVAEQSSNSNDDVPF